MAEDTRVYVAVYDPETGYIRQVVHCSPEDAENQHVAWPGMELTLVDASTKPRDHMLDLSGKSPVVVQRVATPEEAKSAEALEARTKAAETIVGGFTSAALGEDREYPSTITDQLNMLQVAIVGGLLMTKKGDSWELEQHTPEQAREVLAEFSAQRDQERSELQSKVASLS